VGKGAPGPVADALRGNTSHRIYLRTLCFIRDGDRVLLLRRRNPPNQGLYNPPGGKIEPDEDPLDACLREVHEETGIRLGGAALRAVVTVLTRTTGAQWLLFVFVADRPSGPADPIATDEGELSWVALAEIPTLPVVSDIPLMLPYLFTPQEGTVMGKVHYENDEADSMLDYEFRTR
jgi:8-oxo-dGTP diphosphatase